LGSQRATHNPQPATRVTNRTNETNQTNRTGVLRRLAPSPCRRFNLSTALQVANQSNQFNQSNGFRAVSPSRRFAVSISPKHFKPITNATNATNRTNGYGSIPKRSHLKRF
jgi:hypothetical protein